MTEPVKNPRVKGLRFSPSTQKRLLDTIKDKRICGEIEHRCLVTDFIPEFRPFSEIKADVVRVRDATRALVNTIESTQWESGIIIRQIAETSEDEDIRKLGIRLRPESDESDPLERFLEQATSIENLLSKTVSAFKLTRGRKRKSSPIFLALAVLEIFDDNNLKATTYFDGHYFKSLQIIFRELLPEIGDEAHRRYGEIAIKEKSRYYAVRDRIT